MSTGKDEPSATAPGQAEPAAWLEVDEGTGEALDATLIKPDGGEPGLRFEPLYSAPSAIQPRDDLDVAVTEICHQLGAKDGDNMIQMLFDAARDAARYRWLSAQECGNVCGKGGPDEDCYLQLNPRDMDAAIDAAMATTESRGDDRG